MATNIEELRTLVDDKVEDAQFELLNDPYINEALKILEDDVPNKSVQTYAVSSNTTQFSLPTNYDLGYGWDGIISIENPVMSSGDLSPKFIYLSRKWATVQVNRYGFHLYTNATTTVMRFTSNISSDMRVTYRAPYTISETESDLPTHLDYILATLAASLKASAIANRTRQLKNFTRPEDFINYTITAREWETKAKDLREEYEKRIVPYKHILHPETVEVRSMINRIVR